MLKPPSVATKNLIKARELIADEKNWCTHTVLNEQGQMCAWGAVMMARDGYVGCRLREEEKILDVAAKRLFPSDDVGGFRFIQVNNTRGHAAVMCLFDRAIELSLEAVSA